jgi:phosphoribosylformylglycinamidine synthase
MTIARLKDTDVVTAADAAEVGLSADEFERAKAILGRVPNKVELGCFSAMWSEHCSYKSSRAHLGKLPTTGPRVLVGPGENAGVVDVGEGYAVCFKVESHNHPSFIEPHQGAATGVGGILRDVFTMGARPIAAMNLLRFGRAAHPKTPHLVKGVVKGIGSYGNCFGVPTVYSDVDFDASFDGNILVNAFALGVIKHKGDDGEEVPGIFKGRAEGVGNPVLYVGAKTGRDGIHGATMASDSFSDEKETSRPTVQVGDPFKEKLLLEACHECFKSGALVGIQDMGAAGLTSSAFEMASRAGSGIVLDLDRVPTRETHMTAYELLLSESQERMLLVAERGREDDVRTIFEKWDLDCVEIGEVTDDGMVRVRLHDVEVGVLPARALADEAPKYERPYAKPADHDAKVAVDDALLQKASVEEIADRLLASPRIASRKWIYRQFDREVGVGTLLDGTRAPAALVAIPETDRAVALALCCDSRAAGLDPREGGRRAVIEGVLRTSALGATPIGASDCLNYGNPQRPEIMWQLVEGIEGIAEACKALDVPIVSGNVSLYNQTDDAAVLPTPTVGVVGLVEDARPMAPPFAIQEGDVIARIGTPPTKLTASLSHALFAEKLAGPLPPMDLKQVKNLAESLRSLRFSSVVKDARPVFAGGMFATLAELAMVSKRGLEVVLPADDDARTTLFGEDTPHALVVVQQARARFLPRHTVLGTVKGTALVVKHGDRTLFSREVATLREQSEAVLPAIVAGSASAAPSEGAPPAAAATKKAASAKAPAKGKAK